MLPAAQPHLAPFLCSDLLVKSEAELDAKLGELHYRIEHESISLGEEKAAMATIKKLEAQRERVRGRRDCCRGLTPASSSACSSIVVAVTCVV